VTENDQTEVEERDEQDLFVNEVDAEIAEEAAEAPAEETAEETAEEAAEEAAAKPPASGTVDRFMDLLGNVPETPDEGLLSKVDESIVKDFSPQAREVMRHLLAERARDRAEQTAWRQAEEAKLKDASAAVEKKHRDFLRKRESFAKALNSPGMMKVLEKATSEESLPDAFTPEGQSARIERAVAQQFQEAFKDVRAEADHEARESQYLAIADRYPQMSDPKFKGEVRTILTGWRDQGQDIRGRLEQAIDANIGRRARSELKRRASNEKRARAKAAKQIGRRTENAEPSGSIIPESVRKKGGAAIYKWLQANPKANDKLHAKLRSS
jgi:hypothetical protein